MSLEQEDDRVASRKILVIFAAAVTITIVSVWGQGRLLSAKRADLGVRENAAAPVAERQIAGIHQTMIERDRHGLELRERQRASLGKWSWIDRDRSLAIIPVDRAMDLLVAHPEMASADGHAEAAP